MYAYKLCTYTAYILSLVKWLDTGFGLVIGLMAHLQLVNAINYNTAFITQHTLSSQLATASTSRCLVTVFNKIYSWRPCSFLIALTNLRLKTALLCPWLPLQGPGPPFSDSLPADPLTISELRTNSELPSVSLYSLWADATENTSFS
jgi:hypothetical protein